jgi:hypothetical protein
LMAKLIAKMHKEDFDQFTSLSSITLSNIQM